jgi:hypothetical protein
MNEVVGDVSSKYEVDLVCKASDCWFCVVCCVRGMIDES